MLEFLLEPVRLGNGDACLGHPLPAAQEVFHDPFPADARGWRDGRRHGRAADRAIRFIREEVSPAMGTQGCAFLEAPRETREQRKLAPRVFAATHPALRRLLLHRGAAREAEAGRQPVLVQEFLELLGEIGLRGSGELDAAGRACCRTGPHERAAFRAQEEFVRGLGRGRAVQNSKQGVDVRGPQHHERREFLPGGGLQPFVGREPLRDLARRRLGESGEAKQPLEIALVHRGERVRLRLKATYNAPITMSIQSVNMCRSLKSLQHGPVRVQ